MKRVGETFLTNQNFIKMKKGFLALTLLTIISICIISCSKDDDSTNNNNNGNYPADYLVGNWSVVDTTVRTFPNPTATTITTYNAVVESTDTVTLRITTDRTQPFPIYALENFGNDTTFFWVEIDWNDQWIGRKGTSVGGSIINSNQFVIKYFNSTPQGNYTIRQWFTRQ